MKTKRKYSDEQILAILDEHRGGVKAQEVVRRYGIAVDTPYRWKREFSGVTKHDVQKVRALEDENARLKRMVADQALNIQVLKDALGKGR